ncbi:MAG: (deoxy)nucleoside triphosphate pyrophosphohydrolase [Elusimicrobia bacterium]|nr:(deoxy)nucleoside triphosphate pyrophosphohydrolase [Elusimicrobiota bacterium]
MIRVAAGIIVKSGMVLLARRGPGKALAGKWEFPGGKIEPGESPETALARELKEEFGIDAEVGPELARARHAYDFGEIELIGLLVPKYSGELKAAEHDALKWVEGRRVLEYDLAPADVPIAEAVAAHRRRDRYRGTHPRRFGEKYKELSGDPAALA